MLRAVGFKDADFRKPQVGIASTWSMVTPCNMHIDELAREAEKGVNASGGKGVIFNTITVSDGIGMGTEGMKYSLVSREVIADSVEVVMGCEGFDGLVAIGGCDKNMPGCLMAMARLNRPSVFVYGGTILPGCHKGKNVDIVSVFEAVGAHANRKIDDKELPAAGCTRRIPWQAPLKRWGCRFPTVPCRSRSRRRNRAIAAKQGERFFGSSQKAYVRVTS
jgi:dihydroxy-acid dehydratase